MGQQWTRALRLIAAGAIALTATTTIVGSSPAWSSPTGALGHTTTAAPGAGTGTADGIEDSFWLATATGAIYAFGLPSYGSPTTHLNRPVVTVVPTAHDQGYWMVASDGGIFTYGDARYFGSTGSLHLDRPIVGMAPTLDVWGYWLVASDGGVFSFGDAAFHGSTGGLTLNQPIVGMAPTPDGGGYWLVASDGGVFSFGDARFYGSTATTAGDPVERMVASSSGHGYWIVQQNGTATPFGDAVSQAAPVTGEVFTPVNPGDRAVIFALQQLGKPYIWGGNGPAGYDCSGLALAAWAHGAGITFARVADDQYHTAGVPVPITSLRTGDLVFWGTSQTDWTSVYHTAIYVGGNRIVEATGDQVQLNSLGQWGAGDLMPNGRRP